MKKIEPKNLSAQLAYVARGNPPSTHPRAAVANCFPGLEFDFRNIWRRIFVGIELHEGTNRVMKVEPGSEAEANGLTLDHDLVSVANIPLQGPLTGPNVPPNRIFPLEYTNALADVLTGTDRKPECRFEIAGEQATIVMRLELRSLFADAGIAPEAADPGDLTQSLCSPWQADYRECMCFYWASSRPDFVNVDIVGDQANGHNWMDRDRGPKEYFSDNPNDPRLFNYDDLYRNWEQVLRFQIGGRDEE